MATETSSKTEGKLWYSAKQAAIRAEQGCPATQPARLKDGRTVQYTEIKCGEFIDNPSLWDDAVYLGEGEYIGK